LEEGIIIRNVKLYSDRRYKRVNVALSNERAWITSSEYSNFKEVDGSNFTLLAGLIDSHCHLFEVGSSRKVVDLKDVTSIDSLRLRLKSYVASRAKGEWVIGRGWNQELFPEKRFPRKEDIDDLSPYNPVLLKRICGHIALLNSFAINLLRLEERDNPQIEKDKDGRMTGIVTESVLENVLRLAERIDPEECSNYLADSQNEALKNGITKVHCILSSSNFFEELSGLRILLKSGKLSIKLRIYLPVSALGREDIQSGFDDNYVKINGFKIFADGSLGARTAALKEPYSDDPTNCGILRYSDKEMREMVEKIDGMGKQAVIHAIGDRAVEQAIDAISSVDRANKRRHRIEHASLSPKYLRKEMALKSIPVSVQPHFIISDFWARERLGDRITDLYPFKSFINEGVIISGGSDAPVEPMNPMLGFWAAITRKGLDKAESLTLEECIEIYTKNAEYTGLDIYDEGDFTIFDSDLENIHPSSLRKVKPVLVSVSNRVCFQSLYF
jgi:predicted amidohydrolase YtcJ